MSSKIQGWSSALTLLVTVVAATLVMLGLLLARHDSGDTVSALNSGMAGTTVTQGAANQNAGNGAQAAGETGSATAAANGAAASNATQASKPTEGSAAAGSPGAAATTPEKRLEQTVVDNDFEGTGAQIYVQACQSCHMKGGKGARGAGIYPALAGNPKLNSAQYMESMLLYGNGGMPSFGHYMNDQQISDIVNYVRTELNKNTDKVTPADIKNARPKDPHYMIFGEAAG